MKSITFFIILIMIVFISACANFRKNITYDSAEAQNLFSMLKNKNNTLNTFKGIGKIKLWDKNRSQTVRVAWLGEVPQKLRIGILTLAGQPAATIAGNGKRVYFVSHIQQQFYKKQETDPSLREVVSIPVKFSDLIALLSGRVPIRNHNAVSMIQDKTGDGYVLNLKIGWGKIVEKIFLDKTQSHIRKIEIFDNEGLVYRVELDRTQDVNHYQIPFHMKFSNEKNAGFQLDIDRYWSNIAIAPSKFVLNPIGD